jgi:hypothetical protein
VRWVQRHRDANSVNRDTYIYLISFLLFEGSKEVIGPERCQTHSRQSRQSPQALHLLPQGRLLAATSAHQRSRQPHLPKLKLLLLESLRSTDSGSWLVLQSGSPTTNSTLVSSALLQRRPNFEPRLAALAYLLPFAKDFLRRWRLRPRVDDWPALPSAHQLLHLLRAIFILLQSLAQLRSSLILTSDFYLELVSRWTRVSASRNRTLCPPVFLSLFFSYGTLPLHLCPSLLSI